MKFRVAGGGKAGGIEVIPFDEDFDELGGTAARKFPIGAETVVVDWNVVRVAFDTERLGTTTEDGGQTIDGVFRRSSHGGIAAFEEANFTEADDDAVFPEAYVDNLVLNFFRECFLELVANSRHGGAVRRENAFHRLDKVLEIRSSLGIFDDLDLRERNHFGVTQRNLCVGGFEDPHLLERDLNGEGQAADLSLIYLRRSVENDKEGKEQCDEVRVGDDTAIGDINAQFAVNPDGSGGGPLEADGSLREAQSALLGAIAFSNSSNNGIVNLESLGLRLNNDGTISVNQGTLATALSGKFSDVQNFFQSATNGFAPNLNTILKNLTDFSTGTLGLDARGISQSSRDLSTTIEDLQSALSIKQQNLILVYSRVNATLEALPLLQSQISQQLGSI